MEGLSHALRVLLVDDDPFMSRVLARMLRANGWHVDEATSGAAAIALVERRLPDVLLTDLRMPEMDGVELITEVKRIAPHLPQIVMTGSTEIASAGRAMRAGAVDYLTKPIELQAVLHALARAVEHARLDADAQGLRWQREITNALADARLDVDAITHTLAERTAETIGDACILSFLSTDKETLILGALHHPNPEARALLERAHQNPWSVTERLLARTLGSGGPILAEPTPLEVSRLWPLSGQPGYPERFGIASLLLAPLRARGAPIGLLCCVRSSAQRPYGPRESMLVGDLAARAALAIENARLHTSLQDQLRENDEVQASLRAAQERLDRSRRMESLGRLAGGVAHDFNNVLSIVIGYADLLLEEEPLPDTARARLAGILKAARHGAALTSQLLDVGRKQVLEPRVVDLNETLRQMEDVLRQAVGTQIDLRFDLAPDLDHVKVDPTKIQQVVMNLVINARDATPRGGRITLRTTNDPPVARDLLDRPVPAAPARVVLSVRDTGSGMDEATAARIFEPFFTTKSPGKGTGLGLSMVLGIVEQSGGKVVVDSRPGEGSLFRVYFPRIIPEIRRRSSRPKLTATRGGETILLVEDDEDIRALTARILERDGYVVLSAASATDARALAVRTPGTIALLVTDLALSDESGMELARALYKTRPETRVLYISAYVPAQLTEPLDLPGDAAFLPKPFAREALLAKVRTLLDEARGSMS